MSLKIDAPPNTIRTNTRQSPFPLTKCSCRCPPAPAPPPLLSREPGLGSCCLVGLESEQRGEGGLVQRVVSADLCEVRLTISTLSREALCGDRDGHVPQATILTFWTSGRQPFRPHGPPVFCVPPVGDRCSGQCWACTWPK